MSERVKTIATKINNRVLLHNNKTSRQDEDYITNQTGNQTISACKFKKINPVPKPQSNALGANILNNIKRSIFVQVNNTIEDANNTSNTSNTKFTSNVLLTSPHVSQGLKNKYSQIYLETMNDISLSEQTNLLKNIYTESTNTKNDSLIKKRQEILSMLNSNYSISNYKSNRTSLGSMANSPSHRSKRKPNIIREISAKIGLSNLDYSNMKTNGNDINSPYHKKIQTSLGSGRDEVLNKLNTLKKKGKSNSIKIAKVQLHIEKMLNNQHKPITFSSNVIKKSYNKIDRNTKLKADIEETDIFLSDLSKK